MNEMEKNESHPEPTELTKFRNELETVIDDQKVLRGSLPQILFHLRELIKRMANHRKELELLGFDVYQFNTDVTNTYRTFTQEMTSSLTIINLVIETLEHPHRYAPAARSPLGLNNNNTMVEDNEDELQGPKGIEPNPEKPDSNNSTPEKPDSNNSTPEKPETEGPSRNDPFKLLEGLIADDLINLVNIQQDAEDLKSSHSNLELKLDEATTFIQKMPKLAKFLATVFGSAFGGAAAGGGVASALIFSSVFGGVGALTILSVSFPPLLAGIVASAILAAVGGSIGAIIAKAQDEKRIKRLMARVAALRTMYKTNVLLLNTIIGGCQNIIKALTDKGLRLLRKTIAGDTSQIPTSIKTSIIMNLKNLSVYYTTALNDVREFDQFTSLQRYLPDRNSENWEKDAQYCHRCTKGFNLFRRRHHCRFCKYTFCADCSDSTVETAKGVKVRACRNCSHYEDFDLDDLIKQSESLRKVN